MNKAIAILERIAAQSVEAPCLIKGLDPLCWVWTGCLNENGYGVIGVGHNKVRRVHRVAYIALVADLDDYALQFDHLCKRRDCWNPAHGDPVTQAVNNQRGQGRVTQRNKTHCPHGHPYSTENTYVYRGRRNCRVCNIERGQRFRDRKRASRSNSVQQ